MREPTREYPSGVRQSLLQLTVKNLGNRKLALNGQHEGDCSTIPCCQMSGTGRIHLRDHDFDQEAGYEIFQMTDRVEGFG